VKAFVYFIDAIKKAFRVAFMGRSFPVTTATAWDSMVLAASEEWVDDTVFRFKVQLPSETSYREFANCILGTTRTHPDLTTFQTHLATQYSISKSDALTAIDRALGGVVRAATLNPRACPDASVDPVAAAAFAISIDDLTIIDSIFPDWRSWKPGVHSPPGVPSHHRKP
jgi:hypothetical protein